jgi:type I restriction enzyme S subunit
VAEIFSAHGGGTPSRSNSSFWNGSIPWLSSGDIKSDIVGEASESITEAGLAESSARLCRPGSVLVVVRSGILKHTLPVAIVSRRAAINQDIKCFDSGNNDLNRWLATVLRASERALLSKNREGTTVQSVKFETLQNFNLAIPPLNEQRRILAKLEKLLDKVDSCQKRLAKIPILLRRFRQSVLAAACSGRLTADWRTDDDQANHTEFTNDEADLPTSWHEHPLSQVVCVSSGEAFKKSVYSSAGVKLLQIANVSFGKVIWEQRNFLPSSYLSSHSSLVLRSGDVVMALNRPLLNWRIKVAQITESDLPAILYQRVGRISPINGSIKLTSTFLLLFLQSWYFIHELNSKLRGTDQPYVNPPEMLEIVIRVPPLGEQAEIVRRVDELFALADQVEARYAKATQYVDNLQQSILAKAFRGELVPQDPNDEPASALLERIREARGTKLIKGLPAKMRT